MSRGLNSTTLAALSEREVKVFFAVKLEFDTPLHLWSGLGNVKINGDIYTGGGSLLGLSKVDETFEISARGAQISLSGIPSTETEPMRLALTQNYQGKKGSIFLTVLDGNSTIDLANTDVDNGSLFDKVFVGFMDMMNIDEGEETSTINLALESRLAVLRRPVNRRFTPNWLKSKFPDDKGLDFTNNTPLQKIRWGR
jgi:hypothetical protein